MPFSPTRPTTMRSVATATLTMRGAINSGQRDNRQQWVGCVEVHPKPIPDSRASFRGGGPQTQAMFRCALLDRRARSRLFKCGRFQHLQITF